MEYTNYTIRVFAFTDKGQGEPSADIVVRTDEHSKKMNVDGCNNSLCVLCSCDMLFYLWSLLLDVVWR